MSSEQPQDLNTYRDFQITLNLLELTNLSPVRVRYKQKDPSPPWEPGKNFSQKQGNLQEIRRGDINVGVHLFGRYVDVDVDTDSTFMRRAIAEWIPFCSHVWGRPSRPSTHYLYELRDEFDPTHHPVLKHLKKFEECKTEVRGGAASRGDFTVMPGSIHPSGEPYTWDDSERAQSTVSQTDAETLIPALRMAGACAVLGPHWIEGSRNEMAMALAGFLYRCYAMLAANGATDEMFALSPDEARDFFERFLRVVEDDSNDKQARIKTFDQTWRKAEKNVPTIGANRIGEITGDGEIVRKLYALLSDSHTFQELESFLDRFVVWEGPGQAIDLEAVKIGRTKCNMTADQFKNSFGHLRLEMNGKPKMMAPMLFTHPSATRVAGFTFRPNQPMICEERDGTYVNEWSGFEIQPHESKVTDKDIEPFLEYLWEILANEHEERYKWMLHWIADLFQNPHRKPGTALVLVGKPGAGKSFLGEQILRRIVGKSHSTVTSKVDSITKNFNSIFDNRVLVQCDEATNNRQKQVAAQLKSLITDDTIQIEQKNVDAYQKPNLIRFIFTSNDVNDAIAITDGIEDRRYTVFSVSSRHRNEIKGYWTPFLEWLTPLNLSKIHRYLQDHPVDEQLIMRPVHTYAKEVMSTHSGSSFDHWLHEMVVRGHPLAPEVHTQPSDAFDTIEQASGTMIVREDWPKYINTKMLQRDYEYWRKGRGVREADPYNEQQILQQMRDRGFEPNAKWRPRVAYFDERANKQVKGRVSVREMPSIRTIRDYLRGIFGYIEIDEDSNEEGDPEIQSQETTDF